MATQSMFDFYYRMLQQSQTPETVNTPMEDEIDGVYIDSQWVNDYRAAIKEGKRTGDAGAVEVGRTRSGFMFRLNNYADFEKLFTLRPKYHGVRLPREALSYKERKPNIWEGAPDLRGQAFRDRNVFDWVSTHSQIVFVYPFQIRTFKQLVAVHFGNKTIYRGDGTENSDYLTDLPLDLQEALVKAGGYGSRESLVAAFGEYTMGLF